MGDEELRIDGTTIGERLATIDGKLNLLLFQLTAVEPRMKELEDFRIETEKKLATMAGTAAQIKTWLPILIAACALVWSVLNT